MKALVLLTLFGMTLIILVAYRWLKRRWPCFTAAIRQVTPPLLGGVLPGITVAFFTLSFLAMLLLYPWCYAVGAGNHYLRYRLLLCDLPLPVQSVVGLLLILFMSTLTFGLVAAEVPRRWWRTATIAILAWCGVYSLLPFHLSAPDFDDFFIIDKFLCSVAKGWCNDKPFFTIFDYLFRITDLAVPTFEAPFFRFSVNGWMYVLFHLNLVVMLCRALGERARQSLGRLGSAGALGLSLIYLGPVVLAHGANYELAGATFFLLSFNVLEFIRRAAVPDERHAGAILAWCSIGLLIQSYSHNQMNAMWIVVLLHGGLALASIGRLRKCLPLWSLLLGCSVLLFPLENYRAIGDVFRLSATVNAGIETNAIWIAVLVHAGLAFACIEKLRKHLLLWGLLLGCSVVIFSVGGHRAVGDVFRLSANSDFLEILGIIAGGTVIVGLVWFCRTGRMKRWVRTAESGDTALLVYGLYVGASALLFVVPNQMVPGIPFPILPIHWNMGTNHARYSAMFYPFACLVLGMLVVSIRASISHRLLAFAAVAAMAILWNQCYVVGFYSVNSYGNNGRGSNLSLQRSMMAAQHSGSALVSQVDTGSPFQRNMRPYAALKKELDRAPDGPFYFFPIPRDHGDHYLMRAVRPRSSITNLCKVGARPTSGRVLVSRHTLAVLALEAPGEQAAGLLRSSVPPVYRTLDDTNWEVQLLPVNTVDWDGLNAWYHRFEGKRFDFSKTEGQTTVGETEDGRSLDQPESCVRWIIPPGREAAISAAFLPNNVALPFMVKNIRVDRERLIVAVADRSTGRDGEVVARYGQGEPWQNGYTNLNGVVLSGAQPTTGAPDAATGYINWLQMRNLGETDWRRIWIRDLQSPHPETNHTPRHRLLYRGDQFLPTPNPYVYYCIVWTLLASLVYGIHAVDAVRSAAVLRLAGMVVVMVCAMVSAGVEMWIVFALAR